MVLLIRKWDETNNLLKAHLHSTMVLLIRLRKLPRKRLSSIYIPLWFYLYQSQAEYAQAQIDLHSTMVLLIPIQASGNSHKTYIYIPLWFYLYFARNWDSLREIIFTFHYGSTYTKMQEQLNKSVKSFTFHYGSTYTDTAQGWYHFLIHLHSTMVLLIRRKWPEIRNWTGIYIPLWFYLYAYTFKTPLKAFYIYIPLWFYLYEGALYDTAMTGNPFTFHYGSTYTTKCQRLF